jgi:hypothetical protein
MTETSTSGNFSNAELGGTVAPCPLRKPSHWLEIEMVGEDGSPVPLLLFEVKLPDGKIVKGCLDDQGFARLDQIVTPGVCQLSFPEFDRDVWAPLTANPGPSA